MKQEELITRLEDLMGMGSDNEALEQAIKEIKAKPCSDAISRAEAQTEIMMFAGNCKSDEEEIYIKVSDAVQLLRDLPSVHAETVTEFADRCRECGKSRTGHWIETAEEYYKAINEYGGGVNEDTPYFTDDCACSVCLAKFSVIDNETERFDYCPNCGAKMGKQT